MKFVLDASVFFSSWEIQGDWFTPPSVLDELRDPRSRYRLEVLTVHGLTVQSPTPPFRARVREAMVSSGDAGVLSPADRDLLALALELGATIVSDDFAVQNVAHRLNIPTLPVHQRPASPRTWRYRCTGCGRYFSEPGCCPVCGSAMKRTIK